MWVTQNPSATLMTIRRPSRSHGTADLPEPERNARILMVSAAF